MLLSSDGPLLAWLGCTFYDHKFMTVPFYGGRSKSCGTFCNASDRAGVFPLPCAWPSPLSETFSTIGPVVQQGTCFRVRLQQGGWVTVKQGQLDVCRRVDPREPSRTPVPSGEPGSPGPERPPSNPSSRERRKDEPKPKGAERASTPQQAGPQPEDLKSGLLLHGRAWHAGVVAPRRPSVGQPLLRAAFEFASPHRGI